MSEPIPVIVTGGAGYIGSHTCKALAQHGYLPITVDDLSNGTKEAVKWGPFEEADIIDADKLTQIFETYHPKAVLHFAAFIAVAESVEKPGKYYHNNTFGSMVLCKTMQRMGINNLVFSSTAAVYGSPNCDDPITEDAPTAPINPYGSSKLKVEEILQMEDTTFGLRSVALRYFNAAGADPELETGCYHKKPDNLIPVVMNVLSGKQECLEIFGTDYETLDGTAIRDYIHVSDLAEAHVKALDYLLSGGSTTIINLGTGRGCSVRDVVRAAETVSGNSLAVKEMPRRPGDPALLIADPSRAKEILGWQAQYTDLEVIVDSAWRWTQHLQEIQA